MTMILVDTSVWVDHLRKKDEQLIVLLNQHRVLMHPMICGELACGCLHQRIQILNLLKNLPQITEANHEEALFFMEQYKLMGKGIGFIDLHLLAAVFLQTNTQLWTRDRRLDALAGSLNVGWISAH